MKNFIWKTQKLYCKCRGVFRNLNIVDIFSEKFHHRCFTGF